MMKNFSTPSFVSGVIAGLLLAGAWFFSQNEDLSLALSSSTHTASTTSMASSFVSVANQSAGDTVMVDLASVPLPSIWIAVREVTGSELGNVLGAARVSGSAEEVTAPVSLLRNTTPNHTYAVEVYRDDNEGTFAVGVNSVYVDFESGAPVIAYFTTTE